MARIWLFPLAALAVLAAFITYVQKIPSHEVRRSPSPDGNTVAVLVEVGKEGLDVQNYRVCLQRPGLTTALVGCREVAYLAGVGHSSSQPPVELAWTAPSQLEIRYPSATSIHIHKPVFVWGSRRFYPSRYGIGLPIFIKAVQSGEAPSDVSASSH
jgi:hypothetical protein